MPKPAGEPNKALAAAIREMVARGGMQQGITLPGSPFPPDFPFETPEEMGPFPEMGLAGPEVTPPGMDISTGQQRFPGPMDIRPGRGMPGPMVSPPARGRPTPPISAGRGTVVTGGPPSFPPSPGPGAGPPGLPPGPPQLGGPPGAPPGPPPGMPPLGGPPGPPPPGAPPGLPSPGPGARPPVAPPLSPQIGPGRITGREPAGPEIGRPTITGREPQPPPTAPPATQPPPPEQVAGEEEREFGAAGSPEQIINKFVQSGVAEYDESGGQKVLRVPGRGTPGKMIQMGEYQIEEMLLQDPFFRRILERMTGEKAPLPQEHQFPQGTTVGGRGSLEFME